MISSAPVGDERKPDETSGSSAESRGAGTAAAAKEVLAGEGSRTGIRRLLPFLGPAFIASVAYVDPGNFATNIQGGARFGYTLLWVVVASNLMAMLIQSLAAKLGIATGLNLAEHCRERFPRWVVWLMWLLMEGVAMATDLAEFLGAALGLYLLTGTPLWLAGLITAVAIPIAPSARSETT
jgi:manganese transport protein